MFIREVNLEGKGIGIKKWYLEGKEDIADCVNEKATTVGNWDSAMLAVSKGLYRNCLKDSTRGVRKLGNVCTNSLSSFVGSCS